jgi:ParB/RepB/Spo0J family partition protein
VRAHGLLQPLVVTAGTDGRYRLIAGHRRYRAARAAALAEVPVLVRDRSENALELAVIENLQRSDLDPVSEARGFERLMGSEKLNQTELARRLSISRKRVSERLRLLRLPKAVQERFAAGELRVSCAAVLERIAKVSPEIASACAEAAAGDDGTAELLERNPGRAVAGVADQPDGPPLVALRGYGGHLLEELPLPAEGVEDIHQRYAALATDGRGPVRIALGDEDADAARAYGCLLEFAEDRYWAQQFVCDPAFIADRVRLALKRIEERRREQDPGVECRDAGRAGVIVHGEGPGAIDMQEVRRQEREREQEERSSARGANLAFGRALMEAFERPPLSKDLARLLSALVLGRDTSALAARGLRYVREDWQTVEVRELKSGEQRRKVSYPEPHAAATRLVEWFEQAKSAEQMLGRVVQALAAAHLADEACVAQSKRSHYALPGSYGDGLNACVPELVERLAKAHLPKRLAEQLREREQQYERLRSGRIGPATKDRPPMASPIRSAV